MKLVKKIFNGILVLLGIAFLAVMIIFGIMMFGGVSIFGYSYFKVSEEFKSNSVVSAAMIENINIETRGAKVKVTYREGDGITTKFSTYAYGFCKGDVKNMSLTENVDGATLNIKIVEPAGLILANDSLLEIYVPFSVGNTSYVINEFTITTGNGEPKLITTSPVKIENLSINSTAKVSSLTLDKNLEVDNLNLQTVAGRYNINSKINHDINIKSEYGTFIFGGDQAGYGQNAGDEIRITGKNPAVEFGDFAVRSTNYSIYSQVIIDCNEDKNGGLVKFSGNINGPVRIQSPNVEFWAYNVNDLFNVTNGVSSLRIMDTLKTNESVINSGDGYVYINNCDVDALTLRSNKNDVVIDNLSGTATIENTYGATNVTLADNHGLLTITSKNGAITAKNINNTVNLTTETSNIYAEFEKVTGENVLTTTFDAFVKVKDALQYELVTKTIPGIVKVHLGSVEYESYEEAVENGIDAVVDGEYKVITSYPNSAPNTITDAIVITSTGGKIFVDKM